MTTTRGRDPRNPESAAARTPLRRVGAPEAVAFLLGDRASWITGTCLVVDGGFTASAH